MTYRARIYLSFMVGIVIPWCAIGAAVLAGLLVLP